MSKIIKKQIRRTLPMVLILCLINASVGVFVFNHEIKVTASKFGFSLDIFRLDAAAAIDTATTTVSVRNAPPTFTVAAAEVPISSSTSPVNMGGSLSFTATANDVEGNSFYLLMCTVDSATASTTGGAPSCNGGTQLCVSGLTANNTEASCTHSNVNVPGSETQDWYAYVCDNHASQAGCSDVSSTGSGDSGSPFYVNHAPTLDAVSTTDNNKLPGGTFTVTATTTDNDTQGGRDVIYFDLCTTSGGGSWATSTRCVAPLGCTGTSTPSGANTNSVTCSFTDVAPTPDQDYTYYANVQDWHGLAATSGNGTSNTYTIINAAPVVASVMLDDVGDGSDQRIDLNIKNATEKTVVVWSDSVSDSNGCTDLADGTSTVYISDVANGSACTADDDDCYNFANTVCAISGCQGAAFSTASLNCTTTMAFHAIPTDASAGNTHTAEYWVSMLTAYDDNNAAGSATNTSQIVEVMSAPALDVNQLTIPYGIVRSGQNTDTNNATTTIENYGNTPLDSGVQGTDMTKAPDIIAAAQQKYNLANFDYDLLGTAMSSTTSVRVDIDSPRPTTDTLMVTDDVFWGIGIPGGTPSGDYFGTNSFDAMIDNSGEAW